MAVGDVYSGLQSVAAGSFLNIQPPAGTEAVITNIYYGGKVEVYFTDGTNSVLVDSDTAAGSMQGRCFHVTNTLYLQVKNADTAAKLIGFDGVITKQT
ncbi:hypothetical protein Desku_1096 [Desulfofundulus kuznetsovii DSM 6115]|uniref:Uncharacterized protein n=1 Tax=Desulfofundulus kuznetsovii (strain DSM 6115 / VKM B-1805 / 17) TaxID=760568 RepID=A0AAU8Q1L3_DESK7|nr:hypothetical protein Desku_1096 [Desulfofundulus kuznetsovii DSM 6115]